MRAKVKVVWGSMREAADGLGRRLCLERGMDLRTSRHLCQGYGVPKGETSLPETVISRGGCYFLFPLEVISRMMEFFLIWSVELFPLHTYLKVCIMRLQLRGFRFMARKTKAEAEKTRQRILQAALDLFVAKGYERTTFEDIAHAIQLTKGAIYWHFKSKPDLLVELVIHTTQRHTAQIARTLPQANTLNSIEALTTNFVERAKLILKSPANRRYFLMMRRLDWPSAKFKLVRQRILGVSTGLHGLIEHALEELKCGGVIRANADLSVISVILFVLWIGLVEHSISNCLDTDIETAIRIGFYAILDTVRA